MVALACLATTEIDIGHASLIQRAETGTGGEDPKRKGLITSKSWLRFGTPVLQCHRIASLSVRFSPLRIPFSACTPSRTTVRSWITVRRTLSDPQRSSPIHLVCPLPSPPLFLHHLHPAVSRLHSDARSEEFFFLAKPLKSSSLRPGDHPMRLLPLLLLLLAGARASDDPFLSGGRLPSSVPP